jgi:short-subunit dehydrogenase
MTVNYSSDKAKINQYMRALSTELRGTGVELQSHVLGMVSTLGVGLLPPDGFHCVSADRMAEAQLNIFGYGQPVILPYWTQALENWAVSILPAPIGRIAYYLGSVNEQRRIHASRTKLGLSTGSPSK